MDKLTQTLLGVGLNENEAKTYLCLMRFGPQAVSIVAKKTGMNRSSCYVVLERLMEKGFLEKIIQEKNVVFRPVEPSYVLDQLKTKQYELDTKIENLGFALKDFDQLQTGYGFKPKVVFFQDETGLQNIIENTFTSTEPLRCYASLDELSTLLPVYMPRYYEKRVKNGLCVRALYPASKKSFLHKKRDKYELRESRLIPEAFNFHLDIMIYDHKVVITSLKEKFGVMIESQQIAEAQKKIFDMIWDSFADYDKKITADFEKVFNKKSRA